MNEATWRNLTVAEKLIELQQRADCMGYVPAQWALDLTDAIREEEIEQQIDARIEHAWEEGRLDGLVDGRAETITELRREAEALSGDAGLTLVALINTLEES